MDMQPSSHQPVFEGVLARLSPQDRARVDAMAAPAAAKAAEAASHWDFEMPAKAVDAALGAETSDDVRRGLVAAWMLQLPGRVTALELPPAVTDLYPYWIEQVAGFLDKAEGAYDFDHWAKDVRFSLALSVPGAKSQVIDLSSPLGPKQMLQHALDGRGFGPLLRYLAAGARKEPWLEVHTESRWLRGFNEEGWNEAWATAAELCRARPELAGMIGSSWFYDPPLTEISPRLAHLRLNPLKGGAFMVHQGPGEIHTLRAGAASASRKALIDSGDYTARSWLMVWPRKELIAWADRRKSDAA
ncbi:MAG: hypothetical protein K5831_14555 [Brevundimonas sp.]|uniref:hypothetical protein n=1 Tax=Brevundimonas sp. TaxID=1871086 RepID=UPI0025866057|nr:hypothetical protein [Brevundimonas sp.]MCV0416086.1 hypothetical protein [Brevundimonas sp.]